MVTADMDTAIRYWRELLRIRLDVCKGQRDRLAAGISWSIEDSEDEGEIELSSGEKAIFRDVISK